MVAFFFQGSSKFYNDNSTWKLPSILKCLSVMMINVFKFCFSTHCEQLDPYVDPDSLAIAPFPCDLHG